MKTYALPKKTLWLWRIRAVIVALLMIAICFFLPLPFDIMVILCCIIVFFFCGAYFWYLPKFISSCRVTVLKGSIIIKRGVIVENTHILPFSRLIHTLTVQTPLSKLFSLNMVLLKAARFRIFVPELSSADAQSLITEINSEEIYEKNL